MTATGGQRTALTASHVSQFVNSPSTTNRIPSLNTHNKTSSLGSERADSGQQAFASRSLRTQNPPTQEVNKKSRQIMRAFSNEATPAQRGQLAN